MLTATTKEGIEEVRRDKERWRLPYGLWTTADGEQVLFNRHYCPIAKWRPGEEVRLADDPNEVIPSRFTLYFFNDDLAPWHNRHSKRLCERILTEWGIADAFPRE